MAGGGGCATGSRLTAPVLSQPEGVEGVGGVSGLRLTIGHSVNWNTGAVCGRSSYLH